MKIYYKRFETFIPLGKTSNKSSKVPKIESNIHSKGDWIDLTSARDIEIEGPVSLDIRVDGKVVKGRKMVVFTSKRIPLGIAVKLPPYFEAILLPRSSTYNKLGIDLVYHQGVIDGTYNGEYDQWYFDARAWRDTKVSYGDRICQFRIQPSQFAPWWVKLKWLFTSKLEFIEDATKLNKVNRGGNGSTGGYKTNS